MITNICLHIYYKIHHPRIEQTPKHYYGHSKCWDLQGDAEGHAPY